MKQQSPQLTVPMDDEMIKIWTYLSQKYQGEDDKDLMKRALKSLENETEKDEEESMTLSEIMDELAEINKDSPYTEEDIYTIWNENKSELRI